MVGGQLTLADYDNMAHMRTVGEIAHYLKTGTACSDVLEDIDERLVHRGQLETAVRVSLYRRIRRLSPYIPQEAEDVVSLMLKRAELEMIIDCIFGITHGTGRDFILNVPTFLHAFSSLDYRAMAGVKDYGELTEVLKETPYYRVLKSFNPQRQKMAGEFEAALYTCYYRQVFDAINSLDKRDRESCLEVVGSQVDFINMVTVMRVKQYFDMPAREISKLLIPFGYRLSQKTLTQMADAPDVQKLAELMSGSRYKSYFERSSDGVALGGLYYDYSYVTARRILAYEQPSASFVLAYIVLAGIEIKNIITIIENVRYEVSRNEILPQVVGYSHMKNQASGSHV